MPIPPPSRWRILRSPQRVPRRPRRSHRAAARLCRPMHWPQPDRARFTSWTPSATMLANAHLEFRRGTELVERISDANGRAEAPAMPLDDLVVSAERHATCRLRGSDLTESRDIVVRL